MNQKVSSSDKTGGALLVFFVDLRFVSSVLSKTSFNNLVAFVRRFGFDLVLSGIGVSSSSDKTNSSPPLSFTSCVFCLSKSSADFNRVFFLN